MNFLKSTFQKDNYLRSTIVLLIDVIVSVLSTVCVLAILKLLDVSAIYNGTFVTTWILGSLGASIVSMFLTRSYRIVIRHTTIREFSRMVDAVLGKELLLGVVVLALVFKLTLPSVILTMLCLDFFITLAALILVRVGMLLVYDFIYRTTKSDENAPEEAKRVLVYGDREKSLSLAIRLYRSPHYKVVGFLVPDNTEDRTLNGLKIYGLKKDGALLGLKEKLHLDGILFSNPLDARQEESRIIDVAPEIGLKLYITPTIDELKDSTPLVGGVRNIKIEDLLGRNEIEIELDEVKNVFDSKTVMVTGAAGSIGSELCRQLARLGVKNLIMYDNAETPLHNIRLEFEDKFKWVDFIPVIGDVRMPERLDHVFREYNPEIVFHAAAYKHVPLMEENPCEAVLANVIGSRNVADKCVEYGVDKMVMVSTDKAVNPTNIMGCTKRLAEIYVQSLGLAIRNGEVKGTTQFVTTRFGNVLGSNGSVIPRFKEQLANGGPLTVTHPEIRRYFMTIPEACRLVMEAVAMSNGTNIFAFDMGQPVKIADLAARMIHLAGLEVGTDIQIEFTGLRPGEKLYEEVLTTEENTIPTDHERIFKAKVRESSYADAKRVTDILQTLARQIKIAELVRLMKQTVPEFKSKHSEFEKIDRELESERQ